MYSDLLYTLVAFYVLRFGRDCISLHKICFRPKI